MILIIMGVAGCGKTTVGRLLAQRLGWDFIEGDDFHSVENIAKMQQGIPLDDEDRKPWLESLQNVILEKNKKRGNAVLTCSALKERYRQMLIVNNAVHFIYLKADQETLLERLKTREHFFPPQLLESQLGSLEEPQDALTINCQLPPTQIVEQIIGLAYLPPKIPPGHI